MMWDGGGPEPGSAHDRIDKLEAEVRRLREALFPPERPTAPAPVMPRAQQKGCICPAGSELTCNAPMCARKGFRIP